MYGWFGGCEVCAIVVVFRGVFLVLCDVVCCLGCFGCFIAGLLHWLDVALCRMPQTHHWLGIALVGMPRMLRVQGHICVCLRTLYAQTCFTNGQHSVKNKLLCVLFVLLGLVGDGGGLKTIEQQHQNTQSQQKRSARLDGLACLRGWLVCVWLKHF